MNLNLSSKAKTLYELRDVITKASVLPMIMFSVEEYRIKKNDLINKCIDMFDSELIVRSSSQNEDTLSSSNSGCFESILNVELKKNTLEEAIEKVINSYEIVSNDDEVFIQPMLKNVSMNGVIFTADIDTLSPYYIVNYDISGSTSRVTSGNSNDLKTSIFYKEYKEIKDKKLKLLLEASKECEEVFNNNFLDIEFAFVENKLYILQVRAIVKNDKTNLSEINFSNSLNKIYSKIKKLNIKHPKLLGKKTIFGVMPDWNPAEIIGIKPKRLALSLYKELITDEIWAYQRDNYGYRNLRSFPLLVSFLGVPYIDVRISFNSFIPKTLSENTASKLVDYYLDELSLNTTHHDKVEFQIIHSCYYFGISKKLSKLKSIFSNDEINKIEFSLLELTNNIIDVENGLYKKDINKIEVLKKNYHEVVSSSLSLVDKIYWLVEDCKRYGTLPFAGVARAAFIAIQFLNSMKEEGVIDANDYDNFLNSLSTVSKKLTIDKNDLSKEEFLREYGHLRPGTYDITSLRYDEDYDKYFSFDTPRIENYEFTFSSNQKKKIQILLEENSLNINVEDFIDFLIEAIEGREYLKFIFTKHLSKALQYIEELGEKNEVNREDMAHLNIKSILDLYSTLDHRDVQNIFNADIKKNKELYQYTKAIKLPSLILEEDDIYAYTLDEGEANYVTLNSARANVSTIIDKELQSTIVCIMSADPGYDYLFTKNIAGLITCYGGANSHMAIRCAELGIPAVIGCGENNFAKYEKANILSIDALNKQVKIIS